MEKTVQNYSQIKGWGIDADPKNDPTYPMKHRTDEVKKGYNWDRPPQQSQNVEVLRSVERNNMPAVFGTSTPPKGLSGQIRRFAFKYGEGSYGHWLPLIVADRVNVVEGLIEDIKNGFFPNILVERGIKAEWKHNKKAVIRKFAIGTLFVVAAGMLLSGDKKQDEVCCE